MLTYYTYRMQPRHYLWPRDETSHWTLPAHEDEEYRKVEIRATVHCTLFHRLGGTRIGQSRNIPNSETWPHHHDSSVKQDWIRC
jgi:hypothetical protein